MCFVKPLFKYTVTMVNLLLVSTLLSGCSSIPENNTGKKSKITTDTVNLQQLSQNELNNIQITLDDTVKSEMKTWLKEHRRTEEKMKTFKENMVANNYDTTTKEYLVERNAVKYRIMWLKDKISNSDILLTHKEDFINSLDDYSKEFNRLTKIMEKNIKITKEDTVELYELKEKVNTYFEEIEKVTAM